MVMNKILKRILKNILKRFNIKLIKFIKVILLILLKILFKRMIALNKIENIKYFIINLIVKDIARNWM
jgi:hypothetical protein